MRFWIDIETGSGARVGAGPLTTATFFSNTARLSRAGRIGFDAPALDARASLATAKRVARCWAGELGRAPLDVGAGIVDKRALAGSGKALTWRIDGDDLMRELTYTHVGPLAISGTTGPADVMAYAPAGWSLDLVSGYGATIKTIEHEYEGETVLAALVRLAELAGEQFRLGVGREIVWMQTDQPDSGIRAVRGVDPRLVEGNDSVCLIRKLSEEVDTYNAYIGRMYPFGRGSGDARVTLNGATVAAYPGWAIGSDTRGYYLEHTATWAAYGIEAPGYQSFKDIDNPQSLAEISYEWMRRRLVAGRFYRVTLAKLAGRLTVGSTLRLVYRRHVDGVRLVDIDEDLVILETTDRIDSNGLRTVEAHLGTVDRYPDGDTDALMAALDAGHDFYTHPQPLPAGDVAGDLVINSLRVGGPANYAEMQSDGDLVLYGGADISAPAGVPITSAQQWQIHTITSAASPYTATDSDLTIIADTSGGAITVNLPSAVTRPNRVYIIKRVGASLLTITASGAQTVDGSNSMTINQSYQAATIHSDGANWHIVGRV